MLKERLEKSLKIIEHFDEDWLWIPKNLIKESQELKYIRDRNSADDMRIKNRNTI